MGTTSTPQLFPFHIQRWDDYPGRVYSNNIGIIVRQCVYLTFLCSQVLPTLLWSCLLWTLTIRQQLPRLLFQPFSALGNRTITLINLVYMCIACYQGRKSEELTSVVHFLFCPQWALLGHCYLGDRWTYCCPMAEESPKPPHPPDLQF